MQVLQCICKKEKKESWPDLETFMNRGITVSLTGNVVESPGKGQSVEFQVSKLSYLGKIKDPAQYPYASKGTISRDTLRKNPSLRQANRKLPAHHETADSPRPKGSPITFTGRPNDLCLRMVFRWKSWQRQFLRERLKTKPLVSIASRRWVARSRPWRCCSLIC